MALFRFPNSFLVCGPVLALVGAAQWFMQTGNPALFVLIGVGMIVMALIYKKVRPDA